MPEKERFHDQLDRVCAEFYLKKEAIVNARRFFGAEEGMGFKPAGRSGVKIGLAVLLSGKDSGAAVTAREVADLMGFSPATLNATFSEFKKFLVSRNPAMEFRGHATHKSVFHEVLNIADVLDSLGSVKR